MLLSVDHDEDRSSQAGTYEDPTTRRQEQWFDLYPVQSDDVPYFLPEQHDDWTKASGVWYLTTPACCLLASR